METGYYKIRKEKGYFGTSTHYMRVYVKDRKKYIQIDHQYPQEAERVESQIAEQYVVVKKLIKPVEYHRIRMTLTWEDEDGDRFKFEMRNHAVLDAIFQAFPRLKKLFDP